MKIFEEFAEKLSDENIDLIDKLDNMSGNELSYELVDYIQGNERLQDKIIAFIKENVLLYEDCIVEETKDLYGDGVIDSEYDYDCGLYNCDALYVEAIANTIGILWMPGYWR